MTRYRRLSCKGALHHTTMRCNNKEFLFEEPSLRLFLYILKETCVIYDVALYDYCLMTNHVHLLFRVRSDAILSAFMHRVANVFAKRFNAVRKRKGHLWEGRFRSTIAEPSTCLFGCMAYIDLNPVRAGMVAKPGDYAWSGHNSILEGDESLMTLHPRYLKLGKDRNARNEAYAGILREEAAKPPYSLADVLFFGSRGFVRGMMKRFSLESKLRPRVRVVEISKGIWAAVPVRGGRISKG